MVEANKKTGRAPKKQTKPVQQEDNEQDWESDSEEESKEPAPQTTE